VTKPGVYEVPFGVTCAILLGYGGRSFDFAQDESKENAGGSVRRRGGRLCDSAHLDVKLTFEDLRAAGLPLGSGVVMVLRRDARYARTRWRAWVISSHMIVRQMYPCQMGTQRQMEILNRISAGKMKGRAIWSACRTLAGP